MSMELSTSCPQNRFETSSTTKSPKNFLFGYARPASAGLTPVLGLDLSMSPPPKGGSLTRPSSRPAESPKRKFFGDFVSGGFCSSLQDLAYVPQARPLEFLNLILIFCISYTRKFIFFTVIPCTISAGSSAYKNNPFIYISKKSSRSIWIATTKNNIICFWKFIRQILN